MGLLSSSVGAAVALLATDLPSDADTPTDAPSAWNHVWPWLLLGAGVFLFLLLFAVGLGWSRRRSPHEATPRTAGPAAPAPQPDHAAARDEIAVLTFHGLGRAERAYARVRDEIGPEPWLLDVAFVECHHHDRIVVRGTFAGRYLDVDHPRGMLLDEIRADVPDGSSALVVFAPTDEVEAMLDAFADSGARVNRHHVSAADAAAFEASVADAPPAAPPRAVL
jgi:hypothetical protein